MDWRRCKKDLRFVEITDFVGFQGGGGDFLGFIIFA